MKLGWIIVIVAGLGAAGYWGWGQSQADATPVAPATVEVTTGTVARTVLASGVIEAGTLVSVGARVSGQIETLAVALGDVVQPGDLIAQIESLDQQNDVLQAEADLKQIEAQIAAKNASIDVAELGVKRQRQLAEKQLAATETLEAAEANLAVARAELLALDAQMARADVSVSQARLALDRTRIIAPSGGTVVAVVTGQGQTVNASNATPTIVKIADLSRMVVKAEISEADVVRVAPGQKASLTLLGEPDVRIDATLRAVEPAPASIKESDEIATDEAIYYNALFDVDNPGGKLRIGMTAEVTILLEQAADVLTVLSSTLGEAGPDGSYEVEVWNAGSLTRERRTVTVGVNDNITAEVKAGLAEGDLVVADRVSGNGSAAAQMRRMPGLF